MHLYKVSLLLEIRWWSCFRQHKRLLNSPKNCISHCFLPLDIAAGTYGTYVPDRRPGLTNYKLVTNGRRLFISAVDNTSFPALTDLIDSRVLYVVTEFSMKLCCRGFHRDCQFTSFISLIVEFFSWIFVSHRSPATHRQAEKTKWNTDQQQPDSWKTSDLEAERFDKSDTPHTNTHRQTSPNSLPLSPR